MRKYRVNKRKLALFLVMVCFVVCTICLTVNFARYPERYLSTWKYQLENDLMRGNRLAMEYYNDNYVAQGKYLFGDKYIAEGDFLNLETVIGYDSTSEGVLLHTNDGNGYFIEK